MNAWLVRLLVLLLVPVVLVSGPGVPLASAAAEDPTINGEPASGSQRYDSGGLPGQWINCNVSGFNRLHTSGEYSVRANLRCKWGFAYRFAAFKVRAWGPGEDCEFVASYVTTENDEDRDATLTFPMQGTEDVDPACVLTNGAITPYTQEIFGSDYGWFGAGCRDGGEPDDGNCEFGRSLDFTWPLGALPEKPEYNGADTCTVLQVAQRPIVALSRFVVPSPTPVDPNVPSWGPGSNQYAQRDQLSALWKAAATAGLTLEFKPVYRRDATKPDMAFTGGYTATGQSWVDQRSLHRATPVFPALAQIDNDMETHNVTVPERTLVGVQIYVDRASPAVPWGERMSTSVGYPAAGYISPQVTPELGAATYWGSNYNSQGDMFTTDPGKCRWWFGPKMLEIAGSTIDEPAGTVRTKVPGAPTTDPPPANDSPEGDDGGCDFSFGDPSTWAGGGICVLVKLIGSVLGVLGDILGVLGDVLGAIGGLASTIAGAIADALAGIVTAILDGILGLFVPGDGFFEDQTQQVKDSWSSTPPYEVVDTFAGVGDDVGQIEGLGCGGPELDLNMPDLAGPATDVELRPFSACQGWSSRFATITRSVLTVGVYLGVLLLAIRVLMASMGLQFSFGSGDDD